MATTIFTLTVVDEDIHGVRTSAYPSRGRARAALADIRREYREMLLDEGHKVEDYGCSEDEFTIFYGDCFYRGEVHETTLL